MGNKFKAIREWKKVDGKMYLLLEMTKPRLAVVFPGAPELEQPEAQLRRHTDMAIPKDEVYALLTDPIEAAESGLSADDLMLMRQSLEEYPIKKSARRALADAAMPQAAVN